MRYYYTVFSWTNRNLFLVTNPRRWRREAHISVVQTVKLCPTIHEKGPITLSTIAVIWSGSFSSCIWSHGPSTIFNFTTIHVKAINQIAEFVQRGSYGQHYLPGWTHHMLKNGSHLWRMLPFPGLLIVPWPITGVKSTNHTIPSYLICSLQVNAGICKVTNHEKLTLDSKFLALYLENLEVNCKLC